MRFAKCRYCGMLFRRPTKKSMRLTLEGHKWKRHPKEMKREAMGA